MTNTQIKSAQLALTGIATTLEGMQLMPPGIVTAIATLLSFGLGLIHTVP